MKHVFHGDLIEVGKYEIGEGMRIRLHGQELIFKMDEQQTKAFARHLFQPVTITVETDQLETKDRSF